MADELYQVSFSGDIDPKFDIVDVKSQIAKMFKASDQQMMAFFSGRKVVIKNKLDLTTAKKYYLTLAKVGAICTVESMATGAPVRFEAAAPKPAPAPEPVSKEPKPEPVSNEAQSALPEAAVEEITMTAAVPGSDAEAEAQDSDVEATPWSKQVTKNSPNWGISAAGEAIENLASDAELVNPDISGLSMAALGENLSEAAAEVAPVEVDISGLSVMPLEESTSSEEN